MISATKTFRADLFEDNLEVLYHVNNQAAIRPISVTSIRAKVVSTKNFDNNYGKIFDYCYSCSKSLIEECLFYGYKAWIFQIGMLLTPSKLESIKQRGNVAPFGGFGDLRKIGFFDAININKCYEFPDGVKYAGIFQIDKSRLDDAFLYVRKTTDAVIIFSKREELLSQASLDKLLLDGIYIQNNTRINHLNWVGICLGVCPLGDILVNSHGGFDDLFRSISFYYCKEILESDLMDILVQI